MRRTVAQRENCGSLRLFDAPDWVSALWAHLLALDFLLWKRILDASYLLIIPDLDLFLCQSFTYGLHGLMRKASHYRDMILT